MGDRAQAPEGRSARRRRARPACVAGGLGLALGLALLGCAARAAAEEPAGFPGHPVEPLLEIHGAAGSPLSLPTDVAVGGGRVYVVDGGNDRVVVADERGRVLLTFGGSGARAGRLDRPVGLGLARDGRVLVADRGNRRIAIFGPDGAPAGGFAVAVAGRPVAPVDVAEDPTSGEIYVTGNDTHEVLVFGPGGRLRRHWGGNGANDGEFRYPATVTVLPDGRVAVVDVFNTRVQVFEPSGTFSTAVGEWGVLPGQLFRPKGVAADRDGRLFVSDSYLGVVQVFDAVGRFLYVLEFGPRGRWLTTPTGLAIDARGRLYVVEMLENKVSVFQFRP